MNQGTSAIEVQHLHKQYATVEAVHDLAFTVQHGEIFGLLGPNGAGKTTTIRMILDIMKPTSGHITVLGGPMNEATKARIGYLPEERGLYEDMNLFDTLLFLGQLKGLKRHTARERTEFYLREVNLWEARKHKIKELSRGMNQKAQFVATILHEPELIIADEPFSGLDPVNTRVIKQLFYTMRDRGTAIVMSTHQMHQVEEMCHRILLINRGHQVLYGPLAEIRKRFADNTVEVEIQGELQALPGVDQINRIDGSTPGTYRLILHEGVQPDTILRSLLQQPHLSIKRFAQVEPSLDEIFVQVVGHVPQENARATDAPKVTQP